MFSPAIAGESARAPTHGRPFMNEHLGTIAHVRDRIQKRARDPRLLLVPGLADDLRSIGEAFGALDSLIHTLARVQLAKHYGYHMLNRGDYIVLAELAKEKL